MRQLPHLQALLRQGLVATKTAFRKYQLMDNHKKTQTQAQSYQNVAVDSVLESHFSQFRQNLLHEVKSSEIFQQRTK